MKITVVRKGTAVAPGAIRHYCGRPSPLGNPFVMRSEKDRDIVCDKYEKWFLERHSELRPHLRAILAKADGRDIELECFCAPRRCHCDTIKHALENE